MKALSIRQPWGWLIAAGFKDIENRTWHTHFRGPFLIHAGASMTRREYEECKLFCARIAPEITLPSMPDLIRGGIIGRANMVDCQACSASKWFTGPIGFKLASAVELPFRSCAGALGFFEVAPPEPPASDGEFGCRHSWRRTGERDGTNYYTCRKCGATCEV